MKMEKWTFNAVFPSFFLSFSFFFFFSFLFIFDRFFKLLLSKFVIREISLFAQFFKVTSRNGYRLNNKAFFLFFFFFKVSFNQKYHVHVINICSLWKISSKKFKEKIKICRIESFHKIKIKSRFAKIFSKTSRLFLNYARNKLQFEQRNRFPTYHRFSLLIKAYLVWVTGGRLDSGGSASRFRGASGQHQHRLGS